MLERKYFSLSDFNWRLYSRSSIVILFFLLCKTIVAQDKIELVKLGKSAYTIVIPILPSVIEKNAARVLQENIYAITSCKLPISTNAVPTITKGIFIGNATEEKYTPKKDVEPDEIVMQVVGDNIIITGGNGKGILYCVYAFLENVLECKKLSKNELIYPQSKTLLVPRSLETRQVPSFQYRMQFFPEAFDSSYCDWRKINYVFEDWGLWVHSFEGLVPPATYFEKHPEYYALINGKRNPAQLCLTHPDVLKIVIEHLHKIIPAKPGAKYWSVSQNDNSYYCTCDTCSKLNDLQSSPSGTILSFVNDVAAYFPDEIITTLAYGYSEKPPKTIRPAKNVMIMLTTASVANRSIPLEQQKKEPFNIHIKQWAAFTDKLLVWDYLVKYANLLLPIPNMDVYQPDIQYFADNGVKYLFMQGPGKDATSLSELKSYLISKLMWDKDTDIKKETHDFVINYYGSVGSRYILQYINQIQAEAKKNNSSMLVFQRYDTTIFKTYLSRDNFKEYQSLFEAAFLKVNKNSIYGKRILKEYAMLLYAELEHDMMDLGNGKRLNHTEAKKWDIKLENWKTIIMNSGIKHLSESGITIQDYYNHYKNAVIKLSN